MRIKHLAVAGAAIVGIAAVPAPAFADDPSPAPAVNLAGTSFLTAVPIGASQPVQVGAVTGDYLYWQFTAEAGQRPDLTATVALPDKGRTGDESWIIEVFDGLRRRQACVAGEQSPVAGKDDAQVTLGCRLRQVRSWAEPQDGDPLPGTYYVRLSSTAVPETDLGLPLKVGLTLRTPTGDQDADQGELAKPLVPDNQPGTVLTAPAPSPSATAEAEESSFSTDWLPDFSGRWFWTAGGGILAALTGLFGFSLTRRRRGV
ncbi:peptidase [Actinoplanes oblitus]|uniref:Peptidase n=1 Tax=Actinoplanes oblitus TaxID=3040509 RepID=A0ABY8WGG7_9ACTN|nr:peptidase [Actinoplanes oblitus]WIM96981.1 peptidase [Actinoplanes oblitus]